MTEWLRREGFLAALPQNHISTRGQEFLLGEPSRADARVSLIEVSCVHLAIHMGQEASCGVAPQEVAEQPTQQQLDSFSLEDVFSRRVPMLKTCPYFLRGRLRECFKIALIERHRAKTESDELGEIRAWKLFGLVPIMLLHKPRGTGAVGTNEFERRSSTGDIHWRGLMEAASLNSPAQPRGRPERSDVEESERRGQAAQARVKRGQVSRARQELTGAALAPTNEATLRELRARRPQEQLRQIPQESHGVRADCRSQSEHKVVRDVLERGTITFVSRPRGAHQRDVEGVSGQCRNIAPLDFCRGRLRQVISPRLHLPCVYNGHRDGPSETRRGHSRDRNQHVVSQIVGEDVGQAIHVGRRTSLCTQTIRSVHSCGDRLRGTRRASSHRSRP